MKFFKFLNLGHQLARLNSEHSNRICKETLLVTPEPSKKFYLTSLIWNVVRNLIKMHDFNSKTYSIKTELKKGILNIQLECDPLEWQHGSWNTIDYNVYKN